MKKFYLLCLSFLFYGMNSHSVVAQTRNHENARASETGDPSLKESKVSFGRDEIMLGGKKISVEVALSQRQHERGLMYREFLPQNEGMIFVFERPQILNFWMKNTFIDLDIGYFDSDRKLIDIFQMKASSVMTQTPDTYPSHDVAQYALEMNQGWFAKNKIKIGDRFHWMKDQKKKKKLSKKK